MNAQVWGLVLAFCVFESSVRVSARTLTPFEWKDGRYQRASSYTNPYVWKDGRHQRVTNSDDEDDDALGTAVPTTVVWRDGRFQRVNDWQHARRPTWVSSSPNPYASTQSSYMDMSDDDALGTAVPTTVVWRDGRFQRVNDWKNAPSPMWVSPAPNPYAPKRPSYPTYQQPYSKYPSWHT
jgi:hypothetical protein